jgi:PIN domain
MILTIDTNIFENYDYAFHRGILKELEQFKDNLVKLRITDVIHEEMKSHLAERIKIARMQYAAGLRAAMKEGLLHEKAAVVLDERFDTEIAERRLQDFYSRCGAAILSSDEVKAKDLLEHYFQLKPPFEEKKKSEFPDAIALSALRNYAVSTGQRLIVVSKDKGWCDFCAQFPDIMECEKELKVALEKLQPEVLLTKIMSELSFFDLIGGETLKMETAIADGIKEFLENVEINVEADSRYYWEPDYVEAIYKSHAYRMSDKNHIDSNLVRVGSDGVVVAINVGITFDAETTFSLQMEDPIDKDMINLPSQTRSIEDQLMEAEVLLTLSGDFSKGLDGIKVEKVEVEATDGGTVDFGEIEIDWASDDREVECPPDDGANGT